MGMAKVWVFPKLVSQSKLCDQVKVVSLTFSSDNKSIPQSLLSLSYK